MDVMLVQNSLEQALLWTRTFPHAVTPRGALCHLCHPQGGQRDQAPLQGQDTELGFDTHSHFLRLSSEQPHQRQEQLSRLFLLSPSQGILFRTPSSYTMDPR